MKKAKGFSKTTKEACKAGDARIEGHSEGEEAVDGECAVRGTVYEGSNTPSPRVHAGQHEMRQAWPHDVLLQGGKVHGGMRVLCGGGGHR